MEQLLKPSFKKALVIDDNETDRYIARRILERYAFAEEIIVIESAPKALEHLHSLEQEPSKLPEFIFLDIRMPEMDGFGFLDEYANLPDSVKTKSVIMMLSTSLDPQDHQRAKSNSFVKGFLTKPLDNEKLEKLKEHVTANKYYSDN